MAAARQKTVNGRSMGSVWRSKAIAAIQILWKQMFPYFDKEESRAERLAWISQFLGGKPVDSITQLNDEALGRVFSEMKRLTGQTSQTRAVVNTEAMPGNVVRFPERSTTPSPAAGATPPQTGGELSFAASAEMVYTLEKLEEYIGWSMDKRDAFLKKRFGCSSFRMLRYGRAHDCVHAMLMIAAHRDLKIRGGGKPVSRKAIAKYMPLLKQQLRIDQ